MLLRQFLEKNNFKVSASSNTSKAKILLETFLFDIIILDIMMPGESGLNLLTSLRKNDQTPVLLLSALDQLNDKIKGLEKGADDNLTKPFDPDELLLRIKNILKRTQSINFKKNKTGIQFGPFLWMDNEKKLTNNGEFVYLTEMETKILSSFSQTPGKQLSRLELSELFRTSINSRSIDVSVARLRSKIEDDPRQPKWLQTIRGKGWVLRATPYNII